MGRMNSRYPGSCSICGKRFSEGADIDYDKATRSAAHWACKRDEKPLPADLKTYQIGGGSGYGCVGWDIGQVVRASTREVERGYPAYLCVLQTRSQYVRDDGLSFGVGEDSGHLYTAVCREATATETEPLIAKQRRAETIKTAKSSLEQLKRQIREGGECPRAEDGGSLVVDGERLFDTQTIYGGGDWFVLTPEHVWYVQNNGADGDNWGANNVRTGGAGAIGWRVPRDEALVALLCLRELIAALCRCRRNVRAHTPAA